MTICIKKAYNKHNYTCRKAVRLMTFDDLKTGQALELEVYLGESSFPVRTKVVGKSQGAILVEPYTYNGVAVDFTSDKLKNMSFDLHCIDDGTVSRMVWKNVDIKLISYGGKDYYGIHTKIFGSVAKSSERRAVGRIKLHGTGKVILDDKEHMMQLVDICESGFAFLTGERFATVGDFVTVTFSDKAQNTDFDMTLQLRVVRAMQNDQQFFYAGVLMDVPKDLLAYIYFKRLDQKKNENILKKEES